MGRHRWFLVGASCTAAATAAGTGVLLGVPADVVLAAGTVSGVGALVLLGAVLVVVSNPGAGTWRKTW